MSTNTVRVITHKSYTIVFSKLKVKRDMLFRKCPEGAI